MIDYSDPNDPNYDPYWGDKVTSSDRLTDPPDLGDLEFEEIAKEYIEEVREEGLLRPVLIKPGERQSEAKKDSPINQPEGELLF